MTKKSKILFLSSSILCLIPILFSIVVYDQIPDMLPNRWEYGVGVTEYKSKFQMAILLPLIMMCIDFFIKVYMLFDPKKVYFKNPGMIKLYTFLIPTINIFIATVIVLPALGYNVPILTLRTLLVGLVLILVGNYLPKTKQNYMMGIRTPWTLNNEDNWYRTHRVSGYIFTIAGFIIIISTFIIKIDLIKVYVTVITSIIAGIIPIIYSLLLYTQKKEG